MLTKAVTWCRDQRRRCHGSTEPSGGYRLRRPLQSFGVHNVGDTQIYGSRISGGTGTLGNYAGTMRVGASQLDGLPVYHDPSSTALTCAGVYDEDYAFYSSTCPWQVGANLLRQGAFARVCSKRPRPSLFSTCLGLRRQTW